MPNTSPPSVAFDPTAAFAGSTEAVLSGTASDNLGPVAVEIYDGSKDLGAATLYAPGAWTFDAHLGPGTHELTAIATNVVGQSSVADSSYSLVTGINDQPYVYQEIDHDGSGAVVRISDYAADGTLASQRRSNGNHTNMIVGSQPGQILRSVENDLMTGGGANTTFVFTSHFGRDEITNFTASGSTHDFISLPRAEFASVAAVLRHTTTALDGSAVIHVDPRDSIKLDGVTKAQLLTHPNDFRLHP
ncbi:MAG TPA: hypothetical protein VH414_08135 [Lichenihabitans sp.]|jgi:hypothetical protein|nr:hypothetical protein [Lichenihabitans sp.]